MDKDEDIDIEDELLDGTWHAATAEADDVGIRVDKWLAGWTELSRARLRALIETGQARANGDIIKNPTCKRISIL